MLFIIVFTFILNGNFVLKDNDKNENNTYISYLCVSYPVCFIKEADFHLLAIPVCRILFVPGNFTAAVYFFVILWVLLLFHIHNKSHSTIIVWNKNKDGKK